ncbi:MAG TPA: SRPBCC domain-containing protein [Ktedonobacterales bacterium]
MAASIIHDIFLPHPPERVWRALTDSAAISSWLMPNDFEPRLGHHFTFRTNPMPGVNFDGICHCEVTELDPPQMLAYTWIGGSLNTLVTYRLEREGNGTRLHFEHSGFDLDDPVQQASYRGMSGWREKLDKALHRVVDEMSEAVPPPHDGVAD